MIPFFKSVVSLVAALLGTATLVSGLAEECRYSPAVFGNVWSSFPPLSISESAVEVHGCAGSYLFYRVGYYYFEGISFSIGVREASNDALSWAYSNILSAYCYDYDCHNLWYSNFSDYHIGSAVFSNLTPNTLYEVSALICSSGEDCEFGRNHYSQTSNISTTPEAPRLNGVSSTSTSITVHFQQQYYSGPAPDGHEVAVQSERTSTPQQAYSLYYDISTLNATIFVLLPNTLYTLYIRANGSQLAGTYGPWIPVQIKTLQDDLPDDVEWSISPRDTAVVLHLPQSLPYQNFATIPVKWFLPHDPSTETAEDLDVLEGGLVTLEDLQPGTLYKITPGYANTTYTFTTSSQVQTSLDANNILLKWSPPFASVPESGSINGYEATVSSLPDGSHQTKFKLLRLVYNMSQTGATSQMFVACRLSRRCFRFTIYATNIRDKSPSREVNITCTCESRDNKMDDLSIEDLLVIQTSLMVVMRIRQRRKRRQEEKRRRRMWIRPIFQRRREQGAYHQLVQELRLHDPTSHFAFFRMSKRTFDMLLVKVSPFLSRRGYSSSIRAEISPAERLALTLRFLATGDSQISMSFSFRIARTTVHFIVKETCSVLWDVLSSDYVKAPSSPEDWKQISRDFCLRWNFPNCVGAIDGKHIVVQAPKNTGSMHFNYKGTFSVVMMAVADANYRFILLDLGAAGRQSDGGIFANCTFGQSLENGSLTLPDPAPLPGTSSPDVPHVIVGDEAFPLRNYLMRPFPGRNLDDTQTIFNYRLSRARRVIENTFGILAARWRIFRRPIIANPENVVVFTKAAIALHNMLRTAESAVYCPPGFVDGEDGGGNLLPGSWREDPSNGMLPVASTSSNRYPRSAADTRHAFREYFSSPQGELSWQNTYIHRTQ